ncbi:MAG: hypothetical protein J7K09_07975 [Desulfuromusa sp.]|nr:hypothetical protein [Desulfuromusa sp.]
MTTKQAPDGVCLVEETIELFVAKLDLLHRHERTGRPLGIHGFIETLEQTLGRVLQPQKPGPKKKDNVS